MADDCACEREDVCEVAPGVMMMDDVCCMDGLALDGQWSYAYENGADSGMLSVKDLSATDGQGQTCPISQRDGQFVMFEGSKTEAVVTGIEGTLVTWSCGDTRIVWTRQSLLHVTVRRVSGAAVLESKPFPSCTLLSELNSCVRKVIGAEDQGSVLTLISGGRVLTAQDMLDASMCELTAVFSPERFKIVDVDSRTQFEIPETLMALKKQVSKHILGTTAAFEDRLSGKRLAVKKVTNVFDDLRDASRIISEVKLLRRLRHENIAGIVDLFPPTGPDFDTVYIVTAFMESDLHRVIYAKKQPLTEEHHQYFVYQIFQGLLHVHSRGLVHRSIRPISLIVNKHCHLKICDFMHTCVENAEPILAELELSTSGALNRWHSAPDHILGRKASAAQDIWSVGAVLGELLGRKALFPGRDIVDQIKRHTSILGTPSEVDLDWLPEDQARKFMARLPTTVRRPWQEVFPDASEAAHGILEVLLSFNPLHRVTAREALALSYLKDWELHDSEEEPLVEAKLKPEILKTTSRSSLRAQLYWECAELRPHIRDRDLDRLRELGDAPA